MTNKKLIIPALILIALVGYVATSVPKEESRDIKQAGLANPASVRCINMGGELEMRENNLGIYGVCILDGKECEEWALFRGECLFQETGGIPNPEDAKELPFENVPQKELSCPEWINCMPSPDRPPGWECKVPRGCEGITNIAY